MHLVEKTVVREEDRSRVSFEAEGGDVIEVTIGGPPSQLNDVDLVNHALQMMVQLTAFQTDENVPSVAASGPALYTIEYRDGADITVMPPVSFPDFEAMKNEVERSAYDLWKETADQQVRPIGWAVRARDSAGKIVATSNFEDFQTGAAPQPSRQ